MKAIIKKVKQGKMKGQFRFVLKGRNGETIAVSETYTQKHNVTKLLKKYFTLFEIVDETK